MHDNRKYLLTSLAFIIYPREITASFFLERKIQMLENRFEDKIVAKKQIILLRGVSGGGKSTIAKTLVESGVVFSTDDFFMKDDKYEFDPKKLSSHHESNVLRTENAMKKDVSPIVIDNTNINAWEMKPYVSLADKYGYEIKIAEIETPEIEELMRRQELRSNFGKNLPEFIIQRMVENYQKNRNLTVDDIRNSARPF